MLALRRKSYLLFCVSLLAHVACRHPEPPGQYEIDQFIEWSREALDSAVAKHSLADQAMNAGLVDEDRASFRETNGVVDLVPNELAALELARIYYRGITGPTRRPPKMNVRQYKNLWIVVEAVDLPDTDFRRDAFAVAISRHSGGAEIIVRSIDR